MQSDWIKEKLECEQDWKAFCRKEKFSCPLGEYLGISFVSDLYSELYLEWVIAFSLQHPNELSSVTTTLWMRKLSHGKAKKLAPGHRAVRTDWELTS